MILYYYKTDVYSPLVFLISKITNKDEYEYIETISNDLFQMLIDEKEVTTKNILIFSLIRDYDNKTINLILPSVKSNKKVLEECYNNTKMINLLVINILQKMDCNFYIELKDNKILLHEKKINLYELSNYYSIYN